MTNLDEIQPLLSWRKIILPEELDSEAYKNFLWALEEGRHLFPHKRLKVYCHGSGGDAGAAFALVDLIQEDGRIDGILVGAAYSSHSFVWAACSRRFCYPHAGIGVHKCISSSNSWEDTAYRQTDARKMQELDGRIARLYSEASTRSPEWWLDKMSQGHSACYWIGAARLVKLDMCSLIDKRG